MKMIYKNWFVHNTLAHPVHELVYLVMRVCMFGKVRSRKFSDYIHDVTLPVLADVAQPEEVEEDPYW